jgi:hypothetical protein
MGNFTVKLVGDGYAIKILRHQIPRSLISFWSPGLEA